MPRTSLSTPVTGELVRLPNADARPLLAEFSEGQLLQYRKLACDQVAREERWRVVQVSLVLLACPLALWLLEKGVTTGFNGRLLAALGFLSLAGYWPWRTRRSRALWYEHVSAVDGELARRREAAASSQHDGGADAASTAGSGAADH